MAAFATKGLEDVVAGEVGGFGEVTDTRTKLLRFRATDVGRLAGLRTADDVAVVAGAAEDVHTAGDLRKLLDIGDAVRAIRGVREVGTEFSVTVSAARSPLGNAQDVRAIVVPEIGLEPAPERSRAAIDVRVFLDGTYALVGVRLFAAPLTVRDYRKADRIGSLRPTVAAAMVRLADPRRTVWDPFCGSGTILAEARARGLGIRGSDLDGDAITAARANLGPDARLTRADALDPRTWRTDADTVITNLPWGKQIPIAGGGPLHAAVGKGVAAVGRGCVLTVDPDRLVAQVRRAAPGATTRVRRIGLLGQTPSIVTISTDR
jgi:tRNA (guanine6-N2)-methyltransferase